MRIWAWILLIMLWLPADAGRCTGSAACTACTSCSSCAHCNAGGGTCGVCSSTKPANPPLQDQQKRCQAITQKGTQCKRAAKAGSSYCWQHQR